MNTRKAHSDPASLFELYRDHTGKTSDKWSSYLNLYDALFSQMRDRPVRLLEIGIQNGGSLDIWRRFFPNSDLVLGCDINPKCGDLRYEDPRVSFVVGDATLDQTFNQINEISTQFDIIIDDGSHQSSDIVRTFAKYFPILSEGGLYVAEDLHCSYWSEFEGGIEAPFSSMSFFKRMADLVNREHWGADIASADSLSFFSERYGVEFDSKSLNLITEVRFSNSVASVYKGKPRDNTLSHRIVVGEHAAVCPVVLGLNGSEIESDDQTKNPYGPTSARLEKSVSERQKAAAAYRELEILRVDLSEITTRSNLLQSELDRKQLDLDRKQLDLDRKQLDLDRLSDLLCDARRRPMKQLRRLIVHSFLAFLSRPFVPLPAKTKGRFENSAAKRDPNRSDSSSTE